MGGPLLAGGAGEKALYFFLLPHACTLFLAGRFWPRQSFPPASGAAILVTLVLTLAFPLLPNWRNLLLILCGMSAALVSMRAGMLLHQTSRPLVAAAGGLAIGNLLLLILLQFTPSSMDSFLAAAALLALAMPLRPAAAGPIQGLLRYLPAVFVFQLVSGLMYHSLMPAYTDLAIWQGAELTFYLLAVFLALRIVDQEGLLVIGVVLGLLAFFCLQGASPTPVNLAMFGMQGAAGCVDMFLLAAMLATGNSQKAFGYGNGVLCAGILVGGGFSMLFEHLAGATLVISQLALNGAVLILYLQNRLAMKNGKVSWQDAGESSSRRSLPVSLKILLSPQEQQVLELVRTGKTYREVGQALAISDSSVKTYMNRICGKLGATNKKNLLRVLDETTE